jgi:hypothetical protein
MMKPTSKFTIEHRLARHDRRAGDNYLALPATAFHYRLPARLPSGRAGSTRSLRIFRRMVAEMMAKSDRLDEQEVTLFAFVTALALWPLIDLLIILAQTANG